jgi:hypothetical protein
MKVYKNKSVLLAASILLLSFCVGCTQSAPHATKSYHEITSELQMDEFRTIVNAQPLGMKLKEFLDNVGVKGAAYDICYSANPYIVPWVFHLGKVRLDIQVERLEDGFHISRDYRPSVAFDGMTREVRMGAYYSHMSRLLENKNKALDKLDKKYIK